MDLRGRPKSANIIDRRDNPFAQMDADLLEKQLLTSLITAANKYEDETEFQAAVEKLQQQFADEVQRVYQQEVVMPRIRPRPGTPPQPRPRHRRYK